MMKQFTGRQKPDLALEIRECREDELWDILALQKKVLDAMEDAAFYAPCSVESLKESLAGDDLCLGVYDGGAMVAFALMICPRETKRGLVYIAGYDRERRARCATADSFFVDPAYRGYGLQATLCAMQVDEARRMGVREMFACVHPRNVPSRRSLQKNGFSPVRETVLYNHPRLLMHNQLAPCQAEA